MSSPVAELLRSAPIPSNAKKETKFMKAFIIDRYGKKEVGRIAQVRNYGHGTGVLAINLAELMLAALRRGLPLPSKARISRLLSMSSAPLYRGRIQVAHEGHQIICLAFELI